MANVGNLGTRRSSSQANFSATFEKLQNASPFLLLAAGVLAYFVANYPATTNLLEDSGAIEKLSDFLHPELKELFHILHILQSS